MKSTNFDNMSANELLAHVANDVRTSKGLSGSQSIVTQIIKAALEQALDGEIEHHIAETKIEAQNRRNGKTKKLLTTNHGSFELETPRDRAGSFEPEIVKKRQTILTEELDNKILRLYSHGMSYDAIRSEIADLYGIEVSNGKLSAITDKILEDVRKWRSRPLESCYSIIFLDAMYFKSMQDGAVKTSVLYNIMGINVEGRKEVLGFYLCESEGASFWLSVLNDLKIRGVQDILIACIDGLKGFPDSIATAFPKTEVQLCIVHQIRNSLKCVASKDQKEFMKDLKEVYQASNKDIAEANLQAMMSKWNKYSAALKSWVNNWDKLSAYFKFSAQIRRLVYTTNPIEGLHRQIRKITKTKGAFTSENALIKLVYCAIMNITAKWTSPIQNWAPEFDSQTC